jgi:large repetitive protein
MDTGRNDLLGEIAADAALERSDFLVQATDQLRRFLDRHRERIAAYGGLTLIDEEPDYLSIAPDSTFRSRTRFLDDLSGDWVSETEVIESASELVELYNPADVFAAFTEAAKEAAGLTESPTASDDMLEAAGISPEETVSLGEDPYAGAADSWAAGQPADVELADDEAAARRLYDLALEYQGRSQRTEARLLDEFEVAAATASNLIGDLVIVDDDDERLILTSTGEFRAEVVPEEADGSWRTLTGPDELVEFYDPTDVFGDLADALADAYPSVAPEFAGAAAGSDIDDEAEPVAAADATESDEEAGDTEASDDAGDDATTADETAGDDATTADETAAADEGTEGRPTA